MNALDSETPVKSTVSKTVALLSTVISAAAIAGWYGAVQVSELNARLTSIEHFIRSEAVTQSQAERYASAFRWENRDLKITVPPPIKYKDPES